jgi:hypothetical protein
VPDAGDFDPNSFSDTDLVVGAFLLDTAPSGITSNGLFFSFSTTVAAATTGSIGFTPGSALGLLIAGPFVDVMEGPPLDFAAVIPEPTAVTLLAVGGVLGSGWITRQNRRTARG